MLDQLETIYEEFEITQDETRILLLKVIEQSIRDYINLAKSKVPIEVQYFTTAQMFLLDPTYTIEWGDKEINIEDILNYLSLDFDWFKRKLKELI